MFVYFWVSFPVGNFIFVRGEVMTLVSFVGGDFPPRAI
jgi:hypothetical protein